MRAMATMDLLILSLIMGMIALVGCESPEAQRKNAEARLVQAEAARERARAESEAVRLKAEASARAAEERAKAEADAERQRARVEAESGLATIRQMERDAAHQRTMENLIALALVILPLSLVAGAVMLRRWSSFRPISSGGSLDQEFLRLWPGAFPGRVAGKIHLI